MAISRYRFNSIVIPIVFKAELRIKGEISQTVYNGKPLAPLRVKIANYLNKVETAISKYDGYEPFIKGLRVKTAKLLKEAQRQRDEFLGLLAVIVTLTGYGKDEKKNARLKKIDSPRKMAVMKNDLKDYVIEISQDFQSSNGYDVWAMRKGAPTPTNYAKKLDDYIRKLSEENSITYEEGKKNQSIFQRAELDVRHEEQMEMVKKVSSEFQYAYADTHPNCSERCERWQGKLYDLHSETSELSGHRMRKKVDGRTVYCLKEVMAIKDKYGYENSIISGFNCRHSLIGYKKGDLPPRKYTQKEIEKERAKDQYMREKEREIRALKQKLATTIDPKRKREIEELIERKTRAYKEFCKKNGYAFYPYRLGEQL